MRSNRLYAIAAMGVLITISACSGFAATSSPTPEPTATARLAPSGAPDTPYIAGIVATTDPSPVATSRTHSSVPSSVSYV